MVANWLRKLKRETTALKVQNSNSQESVHVCLELCFKTVSSTDHDGGSNYERDERFSTVQGEQRPPN